MGTSMDIGSVISKAVEFINANESTRKQLCEKLAFLRERDLSDFPSPEFRDKEFAKKIAKNKLNMKVCGVDSGFVGKNMGAVDLILVRAVGAAFTYSQGKVSSAEYFPNLYSLPTPHVTNGAMEKDEENCSMSLIRLIDEVNTARSCIEKFKPDICFLDGSVIPQYADKPRKGSRVNSLYEKILDNFRQLYESAEKNNCILAGCVEDSRGSRVRGIIQDFVLPKENAVESRKLDSFTDSALLDHMLNEGERSFHFNYSKSIAEHPILMDYKKEWAESIYGFYLKPAPLDKPLRVEFVSREKENSKLADKIAEITYALSSMHREYAYPSILIEADLRAKLRPQEINIVYNKIMDKLATRTNLRMRRENRPF